MQNALCVLRIGGRQGFAVWGRDVKIREKILSDIEIDFAHTTFLHDFCQISKDG